MMEYNIGDMITVDPDLEIGKIYDVADGITLTIIKEMKLFSGRTGKIIDKDAEDNTYFIDVDNGFYYWPGDALLIPTNADKITAMTDEQLADFISGVADDSYDDDSSKWIMDVEEWLKRPAK